jgi:transposase
LVQQAPALTFQSKGGPNMDCKAFSVFIGIDVSKDKFNVCAISNPNSIIFEHTFEMSKQGFSSFVEYLYSFSKNSIILALESTGCYHLNLLSFLSLNNFSCVVFNPLTVKDSPSISLRKTKTDKIDAFSIARTLFYLQHQLPTSPFLNSEFRDVVRERESIISRISKIKNNIEKLLNLLFPELERFTNIYNNFILDLLSSFPSAIAIQNASIDSLCSFFSKSVGRKPILFPDSLKKLAVNSIAQYWPMKEKILIQNIKELKFLQQQLNEYDEILNQYCKCSSINVDIELLTSIKGIGQNSAMHFLAEVGNISRFSSYKKLIAYCGLDPSIYQSGKRKTGSHISKRGNAHLRRIVWLMSVSVVIHNEYFRDYFERKKAHGLPYKKAILAVSHKLLRTMYAMLRKQEKFNVDYAFSSSK